MPRQTVDLKAVERLLVGYSNQAGHPAAFMRLFAYLNSQGCQSAWVEQQIVDEEYFREFLTYFATTFLEHGPTATRVHFFQAPPGDVDRYLDPSIPPVATGEDGLGYLGYTVVRPTNPPRLGETLMVAPSTVQGSVCYNHCATRFGQTLQGKRFTVAAAPFIAQNETGVCAQAALWGALKYLHKYRYYPKVSLPEITWLAGQVMAETKMIRPAGELSNSGIHAVLRRLGFQVHAVDTEPSFDRDDCLEEAYTGIESGLPVLLLLANGSGGGGSNFPGHAVWVTGHTIDPDLERQNLQSNEAHCTDFDDVTLSYYPAVERVKHLLIHDDQVGPYIPSVLEGSTSLLTYQNYQTARELTQPIIQKVTEVVVPLPEEVFVKPSHARRMSLYALLGPHLDYMAGFLGDLGEGQLEEAPGQTIAAIQRLRTQPSDFWIRTFLCLSARYQEYVVNSKNMCSDLKVLIAGRLRLPEYVWVTEVSERGAVGEKEHPDVVASIIIDSTDASAFTAKTASRYILLHVPGFVRWRNGTLNDQAPGRADSPVEYTFALLEDDAYHEAYALNAEKNDPPRSHRSLGPLNMPFRAPS